MNRETSRILGMGMQKQQESIPLDERCDYCDGKGMVYVGCAIDHNLYTDCIWCRTTGLKKEVPLDFRK